MYDLDLHVLLTLCNVFFLVYSYYSFNIVMFLCYSESISSFDFQVRITERQRPSKKRKVGNKIKGRSWLLKKKEQRRNHGFMNVPQDTKYTGRKRKARF